MTKLLLALTIIWAVSAVYSAPPRVYVLDVPGGLRHSYSLPPCSYDDPAVWDASVNVVTDSGQDGHGRVPHQQLQHAGPWFLHKALTASSVVVQDSNHADLVYVHWHCYYLRFWSLLYRDRKPKEAALFMRTALQAVKTSDLWSVHNGTNFIFYFQCPSLNWLLDDCDIPSLQITHESSVKCRYNGQGPPLMAERSVIAPYSTTTGAIKHVPSIGARRILLFFSGACSHEPDDGNEKVGKKMRKLIVKLLNIQARTLQAPAHALYLQCACHHCHSRLDHREQMVAMRRSLFCLVLPGDTQSSRRITEVMLSGCIPVFVMPPLHTLPLAAFVDYQRFAVFVRVSDATAWMSPGSFEEMFWNNDASLNTTVNIGAMSALLPYLLKLASTGNKVEIMQQQLLSYRSYFLYTGAFHAPGSEQGPEDAIMQAITTMYNS